jgi:hypothetical protein
LAPGVEIVIVCAVTAPVLSAVPTAWAHLPTARSEGVAEVRSVKVVLEVRVTTTLVVCLVVGFDSLMVTVEPPAAVTRPDAAANWPGWPPPFGRCPDPLPGNPPAGGVPPPPPPRRPEEQVPEIGWEIETVVAVTGPPNPRALDELVVGLPKAEMQEPTVTSEACPVTLCWKVVLPV